MVNEMRKWFKEKSADGFMLQFPLLSGDLEDFVEHVVPLFQDKDIFRLDYERDTLHGHLGLEKPVNQFLKKKKALTK